MKGSDELYQFEIFKGLFYVGATTALLWFLCRSWSRQVTQAVERYELSKNQYQHYIRNSPISISLVDQTGNFKETNHATQELTAYPVDELERMNIFELIPSSDVESIKPVFEDVFTKGYAFKDCRILQKDGSIHYARVDGMRHNDNEALLFARDITDRRESEQKLLMLNAMLRAIRRVNQAIVHESKVSDLIRSICEILVEDREFHHAWIALLDPQGKPEYYHDAPSLPDADKLKQFLNEGRLPECLEKTKREDGLIVSLRPAQECPDFPIMEGLENSALIGMEFDYDNRHGYIALMAKPAAAEDEDELSLFREVAEDLQFALHSIKVEEEKVRAIGDLVKAKREAEKANKAKDEFLAVMSHEMRTPLNPIMGHCSLLLEESQDPDQTEALKQISKSSEHLLKLIDDILFFADIEREKKTINPGEFDLLELCTNCLNRFKEDGKSSCDLKLINGTGDYRAISSETSVKGDRDLLQRVLNELISNACKYTEGGEILLRTGIKSEQGDESEILLEIEDTGIGISEDALNSLFDPFTQVDSSHTRRYEGIGLGLAICNRIAKTLKGTLHARSQLGGGSCFTFTCPVELPERRTRTSRDTDPAPEQDTLRNILVVEDNESNAHVVEIMLQRLGYEVDIVENGEEAVHQCKETRYGFILMDLSMPVMNGFEATERIQSTPNPNRHTPVIGLTAHVSSEVKTQCLQCGMKDFIPKPIRLASLKAALEAVVPLT